MSKLLSNARGYFLKKKKAARVAEPDGSNPEPTGILKKRLNALSRKMAKLKIQLHDASLAYLHMVQERLHEKMGRRRQRRQPNVGRRKLGTLALRLKSTAKGVFNRVKTGRVLTFPDARDDSPIKDPNR
jgi:hypothetical protein